MIEKSESIYWANVWWILAADNLTFEELMGDFRKKYPVDQEPYCDGEGLLGRWPG